MHIGIDRGTALAAVALFVGAGLFVNDRRRSGAFAQFALHLVEVIAVQHADPCGQIGRLEQLEIVADQHLRADPLDYQLMDDLLRRQYAYRRLSSAA